MPKQKTEKNHLCLYSGVQLLVWSGLGLLLQAWQSLAMILLWGSGLLLVLVNYWRCRRCDADCRVLDQELERTLERCREAERSWETTFDAVAAPITLLGSDLTILKANKAAAAQVGVAPAQVVGLHCYDLLGNVGGPCDDCPAPKVLVDGRAHSAEIVHPQVGRTLIVSVAPIFDPLGKMVALTHFCLDISEQKKLSEQYQQAQKMEAVGRLAGGVAHDFNNILTIINGYSEMALMKMKDSNELSPLRNPLREIHQAGQRAANLTRQLLAFSRKQVVRPMVLQLNDKVLEMEKMLKRLIGEDIVLTTNLQENLSPILADPGQLEQIIINLVVNAADAIKESTPVTAGRIDIRTSETTLKSRPLASFGDFVAGPYVYLQVKDSGPGIAKELLKHIFEPFFTTKGKDKGTGLGLSTVYGIVEQNRGLIAVENTLAGALFTIYWPILQQPDEVLTPQLEADSGLVAGQGAILVVEDEEVLRKVSVEALEWAGYQVMAAASGEEALGLLDGCGKPPDLVFTDIVMPGISGLEMARRIRELYPAVKVLYTSGYTDRDELKGIDAALLLDKPYTMPQLTRRVAALLLGS
ncbi:MAG: response regulator [Deltaproteobacteria bacterium]|nr:response regulator [Deltaproteobacteria bacterium]